MFSDCVWFCSAMHHTTQFAFTHSMLPYLKCLTLKRVDSLFYLWSSLQKLLPNTSMYIKATILTWHPHLFPLLPSLLWLAEICPLLLIGWNSVMWLGSSHCLCVPVYGGRAVYELKIFLGSDWVWGSVCQPGFRSGPETCKYPIRKGKDTEDLSNCNLFIMKCQCIIHVLQVLSWCIW